MLWAAGGRGDGIHHDSLEAGVSGGLPLFQGPCKVRKPPHVFPSLYLRKSVVLTATIRLFLTYKDARSGCCAAMLE